VKIYGLSGANPAPSILNILRTSNSLGKVLIEDMNISGNVRLIGVTAIINADITGNLTVGADVGLNGQPGYIGDLTVGGNIGRRIEAFDGYIERVVAGGDIGTVAVPATITANRIGASAFIERIEAEAIYADITCDEPTAYIESIVTRSGNFVGSIRTSNTSTSAPGVDSIDIAGDFDGEFIVENDLLVPFRIGGSLMLDSVLSIGNGLEAPVEAPTEPTILIGDPLGLQGQIIADANNGANGWNHYVRVGAAGTAPVDLDGQLTTGPDAAPFYKRLSSALGGGATGLAPFNFHQFTGPTPAIRAELSCNPHHQESVQVGDCGDFDELNEVIIEHYGPIYAVCVNGEEDTDPQFHVEFLTAIQPLPNGTPWENVTHLFKVDFTRTSDDNASTNRRAYLIPSGANKSGFNAAGIFRIRPITNRVKSAGVAGDPNVAYDSNVVSGDLGSTTTQQYDWYQFEVGFVTCPSESLFQGGQVASTDLVAWLDEPFEVNMDGETCSQDFDMMVDAYQP
jgi:hypothetical protein